MKPLYNRYFPTPSFLAMNSCALDISDLSIKYGELLVTSHGLRLGRFGEEDIPAGIIVSGKIEKENELIKILTSLRKRERMHFVRISLPEEQMYLFTVTLPLMKGDEIRDSILLQLEEHIPLQAVDTVFDYEIISQGTEGVVVQVLALSSNVIESYVSVLRESGLVPLSFELEAQAIARAVIPYEDTSTVMVVDFGKTRTGVSIAEKGRVLFTTTLDIGGATLTSMIAKNFSISTEEAEQMKRASGLESTSGTEDIFPVILNGLSVLRDELTKQYDYWKNRTKDGTHHSEISKIILCGGDSNLRGLAEYLESSMMLKIEHANAWANISTMEISVPDMSREDSFSYATVLGLALADYVRYPRSVMNVLPFAEKRVLKKEYMMRLGVVSLSLVSVVGVLTLVLMLPSYFLSVSKLALAENRLEVFNAANPEITTHDLNTTITDINKKLVLLSVKKDGQDPSDNLTSDIIDTRPLGIVISTIIYSEKKVDKKDTVATFEIHGIASDRATLRSYKTTLLSHPGISQVDLPISDYLEPTNINFSMMITLK